MGRRRVNRRWSPGLHIVATPIGNMRDITLRALDVLQAADLIACEDTRVFAKLASHYGISAPTVAYSDATQDATSRRSCAPSRRASGGAGVGRRHAADLRSRLSPGPRTPSARALPSPPRPAPRPCPWRWRCRACRPTASSSRGFLPAKQTDRRRAIGAVAALPATLVFFEAPHRLAESLADLAELLGERPAAVARELTKLFEEVRRAPLATLAAHYACPSRRQGRDRRS